MNQIWIFDSETNVKKEDHDHIIIGLTNQYIHTKHAHYHISEIPRFRAEESRAKRFQGPEDSARDSDLTM